jgi:molybdopterin-binding protein
LSTKIETAQPPLRFTVSRIKPTKTSIFGNAAAIAPNGCHTVEGTDLSLGKHSNKWSACLALWHFNQNRRQGWIKMKISGRNFIEGTVVDVHKGATISNVHVEIAGGVVITASITNESVDDLGLEKGKKAHVLIKSSDVMIAVD